MRLPKLKFLTLISFILLTLCIFACSSNEKTLRNIEAAAEAKSLQWTPESERLAVSSKSNSASTNSKNEPVSASKQSGNIAGMISIDNLETIGYKKNEKVSETDPSRYKYDNILEAWDGEIVVNDQSHLLTILIFDKKFDDIEGRVMMISLRGRLSRTGITKPIKTGYVKNILVACYDEEACAHVIETLK